MSVNIFQELIARFGRVGVRAKINPATDKIDSFLIGEGTMERVVANGECLVASDLTGVNRIVKLTQAQYDALGTKDAQTLYVITV